MTTRSLATLLLALSWAPTATADDAATARFAEALRFETISHHDPARFDGEPFLAMHRFLEKSFPRVHAALERTVISEYSLLYTWRGSDPSAAPILVTAHLDVVPTPEETLDAWEQPPFAGVVADGLIWGRGTLDNKYGVLGSLEAAERLLADGFRPERTVYLAFGHDEEIGGQDGAGAITKHLADQGVRLAWSLDEGMAVVSGGMAGMQEPIGFIGVAEKGYMTIEVTARAPGGHSSMPTGESSIGRLARAIERIESNPMPANLDTVAGGMLDALGPYVGGMQGLALRNRALLGPVLERVLAGQPATDAMIRTTTAVTMLRAGDKENVLPRSATATVNFRLLPGDTPEDVLAHVRRVVDDPDIEIQGERGDVASAVASSESEGFATIAAAIGSVFPDAIVAPGLVVGGTDTKHYGQIADDAYRFGPLDLEFGDTARIHGVNERISVENYALCIDFYEALIRKGAGGGGS